MTRLDQPAPEFKTVTSITINIPTFTTTQRADIEALRHDLSEHTHQAVTTEYGSDNGQHWAVLCFEASPLMSLGHPKPLVSILAGAGIAGDAAVMHADGSGVGTAGDFAAVIETARTAGMLVYGGMTKGVMR